MMLKKKYEIFQQEWKLTEINTGREDTVVVVLMLLPKSCQRNSPSFCHGYDHFQHF